MYRLPGDVRNSIAPAASADSAKRCIGSCESAVSVGASQPRACHHQHLQASDSCASDSSFSSAGHQDLSSRSMRSCCSPAMLSSQRKRSLKSSCTTSGCSAEQSAAALSSTLLPIRHQGQPRADICVLDEQIRRLGTRHSPDQPSGTSSTPGCARPIWNPVSKCRYSCPAPSPFHTCWSDLPSRCASRGPSAPAA